MLHFYIFDHKTDQKEGDISIFLHSLLFFYGNVLSSIKTDSTVNVGLLNVTKILEKRKVFSISCQFCYIHAAVVNLLLFSLHHTPSFTHGCQPSAIALK